MNLGLGKYKHDWAVVIPAGIEHNVINTSDNEMMKLYSIYSPPEHPEGTIHATKADDTHHDHLNIDSFDLIDMTNEKG